MKKPIKQIEDIYQALGEIHRLYWKKPVRDLLKKIDTLTQDLEDELNKGELKEVKE
jgi:hypothetical protein